MSNHASHPVPNLARLAAQLTNTTAKRLVASLEEAESLEELQATLTAAAEARVAAVRRGLERADAEVA